MGLGGLGMMEMILIFMVVLLLFGAKRLPEIGSSLGKGIREFKGSIREIEKEVKSAGETDTESLTPSTNNRVQELRTLTDSDESPYQSDTQNIGEDESQPAEKEDSEED
ncbi:MAG: twin-arginine translocase TatA/TatE family subunit [Longimicrobiales bacterium]|jgi:sec-independent protein translocase protein TatA|tara:strand:- start:269 stop:595 length:327 start_codon:yes stop_codon:yes gene_type:complete